VQLTIKTKLFGLTFGSLLFVAAVSAAGSSSNSKSMALRPPVMKNPERAQPLVQERRGGLCAAS